MKTKMRTKTKTKTKMRVSKDEDEYEDGDGDKDHDEEKNEDKNEKDYSTPSWLQISYLLYLTGDGVFLKGLTMRDGGSLSTFMPRVPSSPLRKCLMPRKVRRGN